MVKVFPNVVPKVSPRITKTALLAWSLATAVAVVILHSSLIGGKAGGLPSLPDRILQNAFQRGDSPAASTRSGETEARNGSLSQTDAARDNVTSAETADDDGSELDEVGDGMTLREEDEDLDGNGTDTAGEDSLSSLARKGYNGTCASEQVVFDRRGEPCLDLNFRLRTQVVYGSYADDARYVYCAIPKNGCSYHLGLISRISGEPYRSGGAVHDVDKKLTRRLSKQDPELITSLFLNSSVPKYIVIRNPMTRTLSAYLDKVERYLPEDEKTVASFDKWVREEFPPADVQKDYNAVNPHWRPQVYFCGFNIRDLHTYFRIFRVEEPEEYVDFLYKHVPRKYLNDGWGRNNASFRDSVLGPRERSGNTEERFAKYFEDIDTFDRVASALQEDISRLGYAKEVEDIRTKLVARLPLGL